MLGRVKWESPVYAGMAARLGGWSATDPLDAGSWDSAPVSEEELLNLGGLTDTLATVAVMGDLAAVLNIGNPAAPNPVVEDFLLKGPANLMVVAAEVVPGADRAAAGGQACAESNNDDPPLLWYGLVDSFEELPTFAEPALVWLAFGPEVDFKGSLRNALGEFSELGLDLSHLRSQREAPGPDGQPKPHHFFTAFVCPNSDVLLKLIQSLGGHEVRHRVLAIIPGSDFQPEPPGLTPNWSSK